MYTFDWDARGRKNISFLLRQTAEKNKGLYSFWQSASYPKHKSHC